MHPTIKHIWFDLDGTLTIHSPEFHTAHDNLKYQTYATITGKEIDEKLKKEFEELYKRHGSNSAVFRSLGLPADYWQRHRSELDESLYDKPNPEITRTLEKLHQLVPMSIFTNFKMEKTLHTLKATGIDAGFFTYILSGDDIPERKPALDGFYAMIERSHLPAETLLYVGDRVDVDVNPAHAVGMQTCLLYAQAAEADHCIEHFAELLDVLNEHK